MNAFSSEILPPSLRQMWSKCLVTSLPQTELCLSLFGCACLCYAVPVRIGLCLSLFGCACPYWAVPVFVTLCLSVLGCACLCYAVPVRIGLRLSLLRCAYLYWAVPVFVRLCLSLLGRACLCYAVPNRVQLCWPLRVPLLFRNRILTLIPLYRFSTAVKWYTFIPSQFVQ